MPSLTEQTCTHLREIIRRKSAAELPAERRLAEELRISRVTVRRALAQLAREGLLERRHGSGTYVRGGDGPLAPARRTGQLALFYPKDVDEFQAGSLYNEVLLGAAGAVTRDGRALTFLSADAAGRADRFLELCRAGRFEGALLLAVTDPALCAAVRETGTPAVQVDHWDPATGLDGIVDDSDGGARASARRLVELGHRRIGYIGWRHDEAQGPRRERAFRKELKKHGIAIQEAHLFRGVTGPESGYRGILQIMRTPRPPSAIFCFNTHMVHGAYKAAARLNLAVPRDVSLLGYGDEDIRAVFKDTWDSRHFVGYGPSIARFAFDQRELGREAVRRLLWRIEHPAAPGKPVRLPVRWIEGESCIAFRKQGGEE